MSNRTTVYIAGPVTGHNPVLVEQRFRAKEEELAKQGYVVFNPVKWVKQHGHEHKSWEQIMELLLPHCINSDIIYLLKGWIESAGSKLEAWNMSALKKQIMYE